MPKGIMRQLADIKEWQIRHEADDIERFGTIGRTLTDIKDNHLAHMQTASENMATDMRWIRWLVVGMASGVGAIALAVVITFVNSLH